MAGRAPGSAGDKWARSPLEVLVGADVYPATLSRVAPRFCVAQSLLVAIVLLLPGSGIARGDRLWVVALAIIGCLLSAGIAVATSTGRSWLWYLLAIVGPAFPAAGLVLLGPARQEGAAVILAFVAGVFLFLRVRTAVMPPVANVP